jgi:hypothetical protein
MMKNIQRYSANRPFNAAVFLLGGKPLWPWIRRNGGNLI